MQCQMYKNAVKSHPLQTVILQLRIHLEYPWALSIALLIEPPFLGALFPRETESGALNIETRNGYFVWLSELCNFCK